MSFHWDDRLKLYSDFQYLVFLRRKIIISLTKELNLLHKTNLSERSWHLMLGYWLNQFLAVSFDRYLTISKNNTKQIIDENKSELIEIIIPIDTESAGNQFVDDEWNIKFNQYLLNLIFRSSESPSFTFLSEKSRCHKKKYIWLLYTAKKVVNILLRFPWFGNQSVLVFSPSLSIPNLFKLRFNLFLYKFFYEQNFPKPLHKNYNYQARKIDLTTISLETEFENLLIQIIPQFIPTIFIEGFSSVVTEIEKYHNIPQKCDLIFTASGHFDSDSFKIWSAHQLENGTKLVIGMHGGGLNKFNGAYCFERDICDLLVVHGIGGDKCIKNKVAGQFFSKIKYNTWNPQGDALIVTVTMPRYVFDIRAMALSNQMKSYFNDIFLFYKSLPNLIKAKTKVKLYPADYGWDQKNRWLNLDPQVKFSNNFSFHRLVKNSRVVICTYNATVYLETLAANIPTIIFWDINLWEWPEFANDDFESLKSVGIFHDSPQSASLQLQNVWEDVEIWWKSAEIQKAREDFCLKYAERSDLVIPRLAKILKEALIN
jgi:putative transferase (TIGR04331 family)